MADGGINNFAQGVVVMRPGGVLILLFMVAGIRLASADDTEIYVNNQAGKPNLLLIHDTSESMCEIVSGGNSSDCRNPQANNREEISREAITTFLARIRDLNISAMSFNLPSPGGGRVRFASQGIENARADVIAAFENDIVAEETIETPLSSTLYEAYLYFSGGQPQYGADDPSFPGQASVSGSLNGGDYVSPIGQECQENHIVIFTDGLDNGSSAVSSSVDALVASSSETLPGGLDPICSSGVSCLDELAWYMANHDLDSALGNNQEAVIHTISGFLPGGSAAETLMQDTATHGGGNHYSINDKDELLSALLDIASDEVGQKTTLLQAGVAQPASAFSSLQHDGEIYFALFRPTAGPAWRGNLKRYRIGGDNQVYDVNDNLAINTASSSTAFFSSSAKSFWSSSVDGRTVGEGGMVEQLSRNRLVFTNASRDSGVNLDDLGNKLHETNGNITEAMLGTANSAETQTLLQWARGVDVDDDDFDGSSTDDRTNIGDPLHTSPQVITYFRDDSSSTPVVDRTVYFTTNDGFLHGVNTDNGNTEFSFIPRDLLGNLKIYRDNLSPDGDNKVYGMDGPMTTWIYDKNGDGDLLQSNNGAIDADEHAYLYLTMRRGGNNIYAVEVNDRSSPVLKWVIYGNRTNNLSINSSWQFSRLGQTWSAVKPTTVMWNGSEQAVLLFGGGYDPAIDSHTTIQDSTVGNAVFMVDAERGSLLWTASSSGEDLNIAEMKYSIPGELSLVDIDGDGTTDYFFAADTGGQVFRFDIDDNNSGASDFAAGGRIASLAGASAADARRFFAGPVVSVSGEYDAINIVVGSGYRPSVLSEDVNDRVYVIRDEHVNQAPGSYDYASGSVITESDLYDATDNNIQDGTTAEQATAQAALDGANGWYLRLDGSGEKSLSKPTVFNGVLLFTTFVPAIGSANNSACAPPNIGFNSLYAVNIDNASAVIDFNGGSSTLSKANRSDWLLTGGIASPPSIINSGGQGPEVCVGTECYQNVLRSLGSVPLIRRLWRENR